jgi:hypothetical protein
MGAQRLVDERVVVQRLLDRHSAYLVDVLRHVSDARITTRAVEDEQSAIDLNGQCRRFGRFLENVANQSSDLRLSLIRHHGYGQSRKNLGAVRVEMFGGHEEDLSTS